MTGGPAAIDADEVSRRAAEWRRAELDFVRLHTTLQSAPLVPEIGLHLAADSFAVFAAAETFGLARKEHFPPFWSFAWPGGQGLARYLLDHPRDVRDRRVLDIGAGSGIAAIAAAMAGARDVLAADIDGLACAAIGLNAAINGRILRTTTLDLLAQVPDADLVLIGDLVYEPELATRVGGFLEQAALAGVEVLLGDRTTARRPPLAFDLVAEYEAPLLPELQEDARERARVWRLAGLSRSRRGGR